MAKYKATAYIRLSYTDDRSSESDSVYNQRKLIENFVERNPDIEVVSYKVDDGYSGIIFDRPAFKEMMQDVTNGEINCVIVKDLSRLGREYIETGRYLRKVFPAYGVRFIAITDKIDTAQESSSVFTIRQKFKKWLGEGGSAPGRNPLSSHFPKTLVSKSISESQSRIIRGKQTHKQKKKKRKKRKKKKIKQ